jgi:Domain of unknown function (DUF6306)
MIDVPDQLNRLLAAARAGTTALSALVEQAPTPEMRTILSQIRDDGAWACAGLGGCFARLGRRPTRLRRDPPEKVLALPALPDRIRLLNRGQRWVVEWIDELLPGDLDKDTRAFLTEMRAVNLRNVRRCDDLLIELDRQRDVPLDNRSDESTERPSRRQDRCDGPPP